MEHFIFIDSFYVLLHNTVVERIKIQDYMGAQHSIIYALFTMRDVLDGQATVYSETKNPEFAKFFVFVDSVIEEICQGVEKPFNPDNLNNDHKFIKALELFGIEHKFSPEHVCEILAVQLAK